MRVLQVHNFYQNPGGEDRVFAAEYELLTSRGHHVIQYQAHNEDILKMSAIHAAFATHWNRGTYHAIRKLLLAQRPDIVHCHNTFPLISPSLYYAAAAERVPVIQTLHNYRLICPGANLFRDGRVCEDCLGSAIPYRAVLHGCYRDNRAASAVTASMLTAHRIAGTWVSKVSAYIALSEFAKNKFERGGIPGDRITVKSNFLPCDPVAGQGDGDYLLFAGRLCEEKGIGTLLQAWERLHTPTRLKIAGQGPLEDHCRRRTAGQPNVEWLGHMERNGLFEVMKRAKLLILPSLYHESGPLTLLEAFACGTPVLASDLPSLDEFVTDKVNGLRFRVGDAAHLAERIQWLLSRPELMPALRKAARLSYEQKYTAERNYGLLMDIYLKATRSAPAAA